MSDELIVDVPALTAAASRIQNIAASVGDEPFDEYINSGIGDATVQDAADDFATAWDPVIAGVADAIDGLRVAMGNAVAAYQALDERLARPGAPSPR